MAIGAVRAGLEKFEERVLACRGEHLTATRIDVLQANLGYRCNMSCKHCHVEAGPARKEMMGAETVDDVLFALGQSDIPALDLTGGAPELNPNFRKLVLKARALGRRVIVRTNLTIFFEDGMDDLPEFYAESGVDVVASLPYYIESGVDKVRGGGTFKKSVEAIRKLNSLGYGIEGGRTLNLVYNPPGAYLSPGQETLEAAYKRDLKRNFDISFTSLYTFTNMPIGRFKDFLKLTANFDKYMEKLVGAFNPATLDGLMCRHLLSVGWDGTLYDCDFNLVLGLPVDEGCPRHIRDFDYSRLSRRKIIMGEHCYGCTAGQGST
jgi:radical SAM/Cys-rich protein